MNWYFIVNISDVTPSMMDHAVDTNIFTARKSLDGTKVVLEFEPHKVPSELFVLGLTHDHCEQLFITLQGSDWSEEE